MNVLGTPSIVEAARGAIFAQRLLAGEPIRVNARKRLGDAGCVRDYVYVATSSG